jgi:hypothetical protein
VPAEAALVGHGRTRHGVLQAFNGPTVAFAPLGVTHMLAVVLNKGIEFGAASIQNPGEIQRNIGRVVGMGLTKFVRPIAKQLAFVSAFFRDCDQVFLHFKYQ